MNPALVIGGLLLSASVGLGAGYRAGANSVTAELARQDSIEQRTRDAALKVTAEAIAGIQVNHTTIRQRTEEKIREVPVYRDCVNDPTVERLLNDARANRVPEPAGDRVVP